MKAKVRIHVDRDAALKAILALDALGDALKASDADWPKPLKRAYRDARRDLVRAVGYAANIHGLADLPLID